MPDAPAEGRPYSDGDGYDIPEVGDTHMMDTTPKIPPPACPPTCMDTAASTESEVQFVRGPILDPFVWADAQGSPSPSPATKN